MKYILIQKVLSLQIVDLAVSQSPSVTRIMRVVRQATSVYKVNTFCIWTQDAVCDEIVFASESLRSLSTS